MTSRQNSGFTLVELLVGIVILGLIMTTVIGGMGAGSRLLARETSNRTDRAHWIAEAELRTWLKEARKLPIERESGDEHVPFAGTEAHVAFMRTEPANASLGGLARYRLGLQGGDLVLRRAFLSRARDFTKASRETVSEVLVSDITEFSIAYARKREGRLEWLGNWPLQADLPLLVRLRYRQSQIWRDLIIAVA